MVQWYDSCFGCKRFRVQSPVRPIFFFVSLFLIPFPPLLNSLRSETESMTFLMFANKTKIIIKKKSTNIHAQQTKCMQVNYSLLFFFFYSRNKSCLELYNISTIIIHNRNNLRFTCLEVNEQWLRPWKITMTPTS